MVTRELTKGITRDITTNLVQLEVPMIIRPQSRAAWFDMSDISSANMTSSSGLVSKVFNKFNSNNVQQTVTSAQPKNNTRTLNGLPVLEFAHDGVQNDFMVFDLNTSVNVPFTLFIVTQVDNTNNQTIIGRQTSAISGQWTLVKNGGFDIFQTYAFGASLPSSGTIEVYNSNPNIHCVKLAEGSALEYSLNNDTPSIAPVVLTGYDNSVTTSLNLGASPGGLNPLDGIIAEIIIYNAVLTTSEITQINQYLSRKWGITI
jgi:hypothetical protein